MSILHFMCTDPFSAQGCNSCHRNPANHDQKALEHHRTWAKPQKRDDGRCTDHLNPHVQKPGK